MEAQKKLFSDFRIILGLSASQVALNLGVSVSLVYKFQSGAKSAYKYRHKIEDFICSYFQNRLEDDDFQFYNRAYQYLNHSYNLFLDEQCPYI